MIPDEQKTPVVDDTPDLENSTIFSDPTDYGSGYDKKRHHGLRRVLAVVSVLMAAVMALTVWKVWISPILVNQGGDVTSSPNPEDTGVAMISVKYENVASMVVTAAEKKVTLLNVSAMDKEDRPDTVDKWIVQGVDPKITSGNIVSYRVEDACALSAVRTLAAGQDYGFDKPTKTICITMQDGTVYHITVGKESPDKVGYYCSINTDTEKVYLVETSALSLIEADPLHYADKTIITALTADEVGEKYFQSDEATLNIFDSIKITGTAIDGSIALQMTTDETKYNLYSLTSPIKAFASETEVLNLLAPIADGFTVSSAVSYDFKADKAKYGLDKPAYVAEYKIGEYSEKILVSKGDADGNCYVAVGDNPLAIYATYTGNLPFDGLTVTGLYTPYPFFENITTVQQITISGPKGEYVYDLTHYPDEDDSAKKLTVKLGDKTVDTQSFRYFYQHLVKVSAYSFTTEKNTKTPEVTIRVKFNADGADDTVLTFVRVSDLRFHLSVNGTPYGIVPSSDVDTLFADGAVFVAGGTLDS